MTLPARILRRIDTSGGPDACHPWTGALRKEPRLGCMSGNYGLAWLNGKVRRVHRLVWIAEHGEPPPATPKVLHSCDNPPCCNLRHLFLGTSKDNSRDMVQKGRQGGGPGLIHSNRRKEGMT